MMTLLRRIVGCLAVTILVSAASAQPAWQLRSIGGASSSFNPGGSSFDVNDGSRDIWDRADAFTYYQQPWTGDGELVAQLLLQNNTHPWAKAGLMFRETLTAESRHALVCVTPGNGTVFQYRATTGGDSGSGAASGSATLPIWLKLVRSGTTITGFTSTNGTAWTQAGSISLPGLPATIYTGIAVTSHSTNQGTGRFASLALTGPSSSPPGAPVITTRPPEAVGSGYPYTYQIVASNSPTSYSAEGLPAGLTLDPNTGRIFGVTGGNGGSYTVTLRATNAAGTSSATQAMQVSGSGPIEMPWPDLVTPPAAGTYRAGDTLTFVVRTRSYYGPLQVTGRPRFTFTLGGSPRMANYAWGSGQFGGSGDNSHVYTYTVTAADAGLSGIVTSNTIDSNGGTIQDPWPLWCPLNIPSATAPGVQCVAGSISPAAAPTLSTPDRTSAIFGKPFSFQITANNTPTSYGLTFAASPTRPLGVSIDPATGLISGSIQSSGVYTLTLRATNSVGTSTKTLTVSVPHVITAITLPTAGTYRAGSILNIRLTFSNPMRVTGSPSIGLFLGDRTRNAVYVSGSERDHTFSYTVQAGDVDLDGSIGVSGMLSLNGGSVRDAETGTDFGTTLPRNTVIRDVIVDAPGVPAPVITSPETASGTVGTYFEYRIVATNSPTSYNVSSLPSGFSLNPSTGVISGTPATAGVFTFVLYATNGTATGQKNFQLTITTGSSDGSWMSRDIGAVAATGSVSISGSVVTIRASGADIWEGSDEFHFRYQSLNGDGELIARVTGLGDTHPWAKAGLMFRASLDPNASHAFVCLSRAFGTALQFRTGAGLQTQTSTPTGSTTFPTWLKITRVGSSFIYWTSTDGATWVQQGSVGFSVPGTMLVGLAVTSHNDGQVTTATFDNIRLTGGVPPSGPPPAPDLSAYAESAREVRLFWSNPGFSETGFELERSSGGSFVRIATLAANITNHVDNTVEPSSPYQYRIRAINAAGASAYSTVRSVTTPAAATATWEFGDIGAVGVPGANSSGQNTITISGSGHDIWDNADGGRFVYRPIFRDVVVEAKVTSMGNTHAWAKAGVMIRQSLAPDARNVFAFVTPNLVAAQMRGVTGGATTINTAAWNSAPYWVRLTRVDNRFTAYSSPDGVSWTEIAAYDVEMTERVYAGFAVTSHDNTRLNTAVFTDPFVE